MLLRGSSPSGGTQLLNSFTGEVITMAEATLHFSSSGYGYMVLVGGGKMWLKTALTKHVGRRDTGDIFIQQGVGAERIITEKKDIDGAFEVKYATGFAQIDSVPTQVAFKVSKATLPQRRCVWLYWQPRDVQDLCRLCYVWRAMLMRVML